MISRGQNTPELDRVLEYMDELFISGGDGVMIFEIANRASVWAIQQGLIGGPLWRDIGVPTLHELYRIRVYNLRKSRYTEPAQDASAGTTSDETVGTDSPPEAMQHYAVVGAPDSLLSAEEAEEIGASASDDDIRLDAEEPRTFVYQGASGGRNVPYPINNRWYDFMTMTQEQVYASAERYYKLATSTALEYYYMITVADAMRASQQVRDVWTLAELQSLRRQMGIKDKRV